MTQENKSKTREERVLAIALAGVFAAVVIMSIIGFLFLNKPAEIIEGQADATSVRISGMLPGRVARLMVHEGDTVHAGDTLVQIHSSVAEAKLMQAEAMQNVATAQNRKVDAGTRKQIIEGAADLVAQATAAREIAEKTYQRMESLYEKGVISEQKRDEARAAYEASMAGEKAARSQHDLAVAGAQSEDKQSAVAMVNAARGSVREVESVLEDQYLIAPCDGVIDQVYPNEGELVSLGSPIMSLLKADDKWVTFNVREEMLSELKVGTEITVKVPAFKGKEIKCKVFYIKDMGTYATWRATKATGDWDSRTFEIKARPVERQPDLRPGMTVILQKD
ncbi:MAG: efflux RND transporter periplasmic adaptor subunit [Muribaculaceae bacterium]|nr:efflux RND transporter periplasmic adaptor subunit [Muribaculaceae bacterium]